VHHLGCGHPWFFCGIQHLHDSGKGTYPRVDTPSLDPGYHGLADSRMTGKLRLAEAEHLTAGFQLFGCGNVHVNITSEHRGKYIFFIMVIKKVFIDRLMEWEE
jgi:hypothetical protein